MKLVSRLNKRYFKIDQHLARHFVYYVTLMSFKSPAHSMQKNGSIYDSHFSNSYYIVNIEGNKPKFNTKQTYIEITLSNIFFL